MRIACLIADGFDDAMFRVPYDRLRDAGHDVVVIGFRAERTVHGRAGRERVLTHRGIDDALPTAFDALFIPGGLSPDELRADLRMIAFTCWFEPKPVFAIGHGPQLLLTAGMVEGRTLTAWATVQHDLACAGADVHDEEVIVDSNLVTSRNAADLPAFVREALRVLDTVRADSSELH